MTGVVITKLDGTARGGIALAIARELELPVKLIMSTSGCLDSAAPIVLPSPLQPDPVKQRSGQIFQAVAHQTLRHTQDPHEFADRFSRRIQAMARVHALLTEES